MLCAVQGLCYCQYVARGIAPPGKRRRRQGIQSAIRRCRLPRRSASLTTVQMILDGAHVNIVVHAVHFWHVLMRAYYAQPVSEFADDMSRCSSLIGRSQYCNKSARLFALRYCRWRIGQKESVRRRVTEERHLRTLKP